MATLPILASDSRGELVHITVPLGPREQPWRSFYGTPQFVDWMKNDVPHLNQGIFQSPETPAEQLDNILYKWISGNRIIYDRMFKDLMPYEDEVWEFKTADLRVFGWMRAYPGNADTH